MFSLLHSCLGASAYAMGLCSKMLWDYFLTKFCISFRGQLCKGTWADPSVVVCSFTPSFRVTSLLFLTDVLARQGLKQQTWIRGSSLWKFRKFSLYLVLGKSGWIWKDTQEDDWPADTWYLLLLILLCCYNSPLYIYFSLTDQYVMTLWSCLRQEMSQISTSPQVPYIPGS